MSYDVESSEAGQDSDADKTIMMKTRELIDLDPGGFSDIDPDIRSIMRSNDKLVNQMADSLTQFEALTSSLKLEEAQGLAKRKRKEELDRIHLVDYDLSSLRNLVGETIDSMSSSKTRRGNTTASSNQQQQQQKKKKKKSTGSWSNDDDNEQPFLISESTTTRLNRSSLLNLVKKENVGSKVRRHMIREFHHDNNDNKNSINTMNVREDESGSRVEAEIVQLVDKRPPSNGNHQRQADKQQQQTIELCNIIQDLDKFEDFRDCIEMPECESGGICTVESRWIPLNSPPSSKSKPDDDDDISSSSDGSTQISSTLSRLEPRARCQCPIGRGGRLCQRPMQRITPYFLGHSYLALPMVSDSSLSTLSLLFKPRSRDSIFPEMEQKGNSVLLLHSQKFILLLDNMRRIELRYWTRYGDRSEVTRVIGSRDVELDGWNELVITDSTTDDNQFTSNRRTRQHETINGESIRQIVLVTPEKVQFNDREEDKNGGKLNRATELFMAGIPDVNWRLTNSMKNRNPLLVDTLTGGFVGCIEELRINKKVYNLRSDLEGDTLDGFDIAECCTGDV